MAVPNTTGTIRSDIPSLLIGDYISCDYNGATFTFSNLGNSVKTEIPLGNVPSPNGKFFFTKVADGLLIADRVIHTNVSWITLRNNFYIQGKLMTLGNMNILIRSLAGGYSYADANGFRATGNVGYGGYPTNNEWDRYIVSSNLEGKCTAGADSVWHWTNANSWCQEHCDNSSANKIKRGSSSNINYVDNYADYDYQATLGFRPVLEYKEDGSSII